MRTKAVRLYGKEDLRLEEFELPAIRDDEILVRCVTDSVCMSTNKLVMMGQENMRAHADMAHNPCIVGHEFSGEILQVGEKWKDRYHAGEMFIQQPALNYKGRPDALGFTYPYCGGNTQYAVMPHEAMDTGSLITYELPAYYMGSLTEPFSTVCCAVNAFFHTTAGYYKYLPGIADNSRMAILAGAGPMGTAAVGYTLHNEKKNPAMLVVTDIDRDRLQRLESIYPPEKYAARGIDLRFVNTGLMKDPAAELRALTGGRGFDDVLVMAPSEAVLTQADEILGENGCLNFFAGPRDAGLKAPVNFFNVHYGSTHIIGTKGGTTEDIREAADLMARGILDPSPMITHIGGLNAAVDTILNLPGIPGGKKMIYSDADLPLLALDELEDQADPRLQQLGRMVKENGGFWSPACEEYLLREFTQQA